MKYQKKSNKKQYKILNYFNIVVSGISILMSIFTAYLIVVFAIFPTNYLIILGIILLITIIFQILSIKKQGNIKKIINSIFNIFSIIICILVIGYINSLTDFLDKITGKTHETEVYLLLGHSDDISEVGYFDSGLEGYDIVVDKVKEDYSIEVISYIDQDTLITDLNNKNISHIIINESEKLLIEDFYEDLFSSLILIKTYEIEVEVEVKTVNKDVTNEPFIIYLSGVDSRSDVLTQTRSDVNQVIVVNPLVNEILSVNIPRDYYVDFATINKKDKLTHAGIYGVNESLMTIENLLDIDIDYAARINFFGLTNLVDAIGGLEVYSEYTFNSWNYSYTKGYNNLNGKEVLEFSQYRYAFVDGDNQRGKNQQEVLRALMDKFSSSTTLLTDYDEILNSLEGSFYINIPADDILKLVSMQLNTLNPWELNTYSVTGYDSSYYTSAGQYVYVMEPNISTVEEATKLIEEMLEKR